jgi:hypothetical protein
LEPPITKVDLEELRREVSEALRESEGHFYRDSINAIRITITVAIVAIGLLVGLQTFNAERRVSKAIAQMEARVQALVGEALRAPEFEVLYGSERIGANGATVSDDQAQPWQFSLSGFRIRNTGTGPGRLTSLRVYLSEEIENAQSWSGPAVDWIYELPSGRPDFPGLAMAEEYSPTIDPGQDLPLPIVTFRFRERPADPSVSGLLEIGYGGDQPLFAAFHIELPEAPEH